MVSVLLCFFWSFFVSVFAIPSIINVAHLKQLLDEPNMRTVHMSLTPRLGGIAIFAGFTSALTIFGDFDREIQQVIAGAIILFFIGIKDDIITVSTFKKFFVQVLATGIVVFIGDIRITNFHGFLGWYELPPGISYAFTFLVIVGVTNSINLIDGIDGLAGTLVVLMCCIFGFYFYNSGIGNANYYANVAFCLMGGIMGFLRYNIHKAIIFMGDTGSLVSGFIVSVLAIKFIQLDIEPTGPSIAVAVLILPIADTLRVFVIRMLNGKSPFSPDRNHIHHILKGRGLTPLQVVILLGTVNIIFFIISQLLTGLSVNMAMGVIVFFALALSVLLEFIKK